MKSRLQNHSESMMFSPSRSVSDRPNGTRTFVDAGNQGAGAGRGIACTSWAWFRLTVRLAVETVDSPVAKVRDAKDFAFESLLLQ